MMSIAFLYFFYQILRHKRWRDLAGFFLIRRDGGLVPGVVMMIDISLQISYNLHEEFHLQQKRIRQAYTHRKPGDISS